MRLKTVFVRFYKSFNYDYLRKFKATAAELPWETIDEQWYPFVRVKMDPRVTVVVGANESGKTHLLSAIEKGITGEAISRQDFCRYSRFFTVELGKMKLPDFGFEWNDLTAAELATFRELAGLPDDLAVDRFFSFRRDGEHFDVYIPATEGFSRVSLDKKASKRLVALLPSIFSIDATVALPDSVPLSFLIGQSVGPRRFDLLTRPKRLDVLNGLESLRTEHVSSADALKGAAGHVFPVLSNIVSWFSSANPESSDGDSVVDSARRAKSLSLARDLLLKVAKVDPDALSDLYTAVKDGREGHANSITDRINERLATRLNFPKWWAQDRNFELRVSARDSDLVFTIRDRTHTNYSFGERSQGLKFFLSYYVQYLSHEPPADRGEILLMDEPDAYLSSQAQQDLVRIFEAFADPPDAKPPIQVVYVTHSPFLIDRNHAERIRVLEKGSGDEGTRVVGDAAKNHYEPLRSAFGAFVAETAFIGSCNILVEGIADQVLIAGASTYLRKLGKGSLDLLDLNRVTIVPAGSASHIPYLAFLARGRDVERPALVALLDSDEQGLAAAKRLQRDDLKHKQLLKPDYILLIGQLFEGPDSAVRASSHSAPEVEDLIPSDLCVAAARANLLELGAGTEMLGRVTLEALTQRLAAGQSMWTALSALVRDVSNEEWHIEKVGLARGVATALNDPALPADARDAYTANMTKLFRRLGAITRAATRELSAVTLSQRIDRAKDAFLRDNPVRAKRERALVMLEEIDGVLDDSREADAARAELQQLRRDFELEDDVTKDVDNYDEFVTKLERLKYTPRILSQSPDAAF
jgi:predicted ATPase